MTQAERAVVLEVRDTLSTSRNVFKSRQIAEAREKLDRLLDGVMPTNPRCPNTIDGRHVNASELEHECCMPFDSEDECTSDHSGPELIDSTLCLACGARV